MLIGKGKFILDIHIKVQLYRWLEVTRFLMMTIKCHESTASPPVTPQVTPVKWNMSHFSTLKHN